MRMNLRYIPLLLLCLLAVPVLGQQDKSKTEDLPRVLIIGDSVYNQPSRSVAADLKGKAVVVYGTLGSDRVLNSTHALEDLDRLLGKIDRNGKPVAKEKQPRWDVIHFNCGLGDLIHRAPNMKSFHVMAIHVGGVPATSPDQYQANLVELVKRLKATGAKLVWASTTPIRHSTTNVFKLGSEIEYNAIAAKVMVQSNVPINDVYSYVISLIDMNKPAGHGADPFHFDKNPIHSPIVSAVLRELNMKLSAE